MVTASSPSASARASARSATPSRVSEGRVADFVGVTVDNCTAYGVASTTYLYDVHVQRRGAGTVTVQAPPAHPSRTAARRPWALLAVALATFMTYLDNNIVNVALPAIQRDLHLTTAGLEWVVSGYILVFAGLLLAGGRLADAFGRRRLFLIGLGVFTAASLVAGLAGSAGVLVGARAVQGLGAALVTPTTLAIISAAYPRPRERATAVGIWAGVGGLALAVGPLLGGVLSQHASWGWIFEINLPVGIATLLLGAWAITESREPVRRRLDVPGLLLSIVTLTALTWALIEGGSRGWTSTLVLGSFALAAVAGAAFVAVEQRSADPMVEVALFR